MKANERRISKAPLIDKAAVVAEIERLKKNEGWCQVGKDTADVYYARGFRFSCERIISFLDTLEVKEIDFEKEVESWMRDNTDTAGFFDTKEFAKHFFERGMRFSAVGSDYIEGVRGYCETTTK